MIIEIMSVVGLFGIIFIQFAVIVYLLKKKDEVERDLLNRIMTRNYETYVQAESILKERPLTDEEIYEQQIERGIPV
jgi:hypothetical protein